MVSPPTTETRGIQTFVLVVVVVAVLVDVSLIFLAERYSRGDSDYSRHTDEVDNTAQVAALEDLLATKLAEYLDGTFPYSLSKLPSAALATLYRGPPKTGLL